MTKRRAIVVGGGVTGLTTAYRLLARGEGKVEVTLFEFEARLGGKIRTVREDGLVLDGGPDAFITQKPHATDLCKELGIGDRLIDTTPENRHVYIRRGGKLVSMPEGLVLAVPTRVVPLATSSLFSLRGVARMGLDLVLPRPKGDGDESIASFMRRRLGDEALERLAEPLLGGIYAGDPEKLSIQATFPQLVQLEKQHRSLVVGMLRSRGRARSGPPPSAFHSLRTGMGDLPDALAKRIAELGGTIRDRSRVTAIAAKDGGGYRVSVESANGEHVEVDADEVVLAAPLGVSGKLVASVDANASRILLAIPHVSTATCLLAYRRADIAHPLDAVGAILPKKEGSRAMALTFATSKWPGRAPADVAVMRVFLGGYAHERDVVLPDDELVRLARAELLSILGITASPRVARIFRYPSSSPQPLVGHLGRMAELRERVRGHEGLHIGGSAIDGVGIPDCVRQGSDIAARILASAKT